MNKLFKKRYLVIIISLVAIIFGINFYTKKLRLEPIKAEIEPLLMEYYSLLDQEGWLLAQDLLFSKAHNLHFFDTLENTWGHISILEKDLIKFTEVTTDLYSTQLSLTLFSEEENHQETVNVHPFIAKIDSQWKIIINERDIPDEFGIEVIDNIQIEI